MPKAIRAFVLMPLVTIAYIAISVYFYGKGRTELFMLLWLPMVAFNAWAIASALPTDGRVATKWLLAVVAAIVISVAAMVMFMFIAFNAYGS